MIPFVELLKTMSCAPGADAPVHSGGIGRILSEKGAIDLREERNGVAMMAGPNSISWKDGSH